MKILLIDDNSELLEILAESLSCEGLDVHTFCGSEVEIVNQVTALQPDWVLLDMHLPGTSGIEIGSRLKSNPLTSGISLALMSGDVTEKISGQCRALGFSAIVSKPFSFEKVSEIFKSLPAAHSMQKLAA